jgi:steroid 5-alpha reductase family enzyme
VQSVLAFLISGYVIAILIMAALWVVSLRLGKASIVDPVWAAVIALLAVMYGTMADGFELRRFFITIMGVLWGMRLCFFILFYRVIGKKEDPRYTELLSKWKNKNLKLLQFFLIQGVVAGFFSMPFLVVSLNPSPRLSFVEWLGFVLWLAAFVGETTADVELELFKSNAANKGKTCRVGLWQYSRHPNYFFEFMIWCSVFIFSLGSPYGIFTVLCPAAIFYFLFNVTGIPKAEEQALRSRGDDYRDYQRKTSKFFPWFPKEG